MRIYQGQVKQHGIAVSGRDRTVYSSVAIGDHILENLVVNSRLDSFLVDGFQTCRSVKLWTIDMPFRRHGLIALQIAMRRKYISPPFSLYTAFLSGLSFTLLAIRFLVASGPAFWILGVIMLAGAVWFSFLPVAGYLSGPRDGIRV